MPKSQRNGRLPNELACGNRERAGNNGQTSRHRRETEAYETRTEISKGAYNKHAMAPRNNDSTRGQAVRARHTDVCNDNLSSMVLLKITQSGSGAGRP